MYCTGECLAEQCRSSRGLTDLPQLIELGNIGALGLILTLFIQPVLRHNQESALDSELYIKTSWKQTNARASLDLVIRSKCPM